MKSESEVPDKVDSVRLDAPGSQGLDGVGSESLGGPGSQGLDGIGSESLGEPISQGLDVVEFGRAWISGSGQGWF